MPKPEVSRDYFSKAFIQNQNWLNKYEQYMKKNNKYNSERHKILQDLFSFNDFSSKPFNEFTLNEVKEYIDVYIKHGYKPDSIIKILSNLSALITFINKEGPFINLQFQTEINNLKKIYESKSTKKGVVFNKRQLSKIREYNKDDPKLNYYFELVFQLGLKKKDIQFCKPENLNRNKNAFIKPDGEEIKLNSKIMDLINTEYPISMDISYYMFSKCMERITKGLKKENNFYKKTNLNYYDIKDSSENFFMVCPNCKNRLENDMKNWVLANLLIEVKP